MRPDTKPDGQSRTFIEEARRAQIVAAAIEVLAEVGFGHASLALIAKRAGISKGVISYHFAGKDELMEQVVETAYGDVAAHVVPLMTGLTTGSDLLRTHILSVTEYMAGHRAHVIAIGEVASNLRTPEGSLRFGVHTSDALYEALEGIYHLGQARGEFRPFDTRVMAVTHQSAIDAMFAYWAVHPDHDLDAHAHALVDLFLRATRADSGGNPS